MKNLTSIKITLFCMCLFLLSIETQAAGKTKFDSLSVLQIEGKISNLDENFEEECVVELIWMNDVVETRVLKEGKKKFKFVLNKNSSYSIRISKKGYISKLISVDTQIPADNESFGLFKFTFETSLMKEALADKLNKDMMDFPIAIIRFDFELDGFSYDKKYTAHIKRELHRPMATQTNIEKKATASASN
jgi:hypothetical protein